MSTPTTAIILIAVALGVIRASGFKDEAFQAIAHLVVGYIFAAWRFTGGRWRNPWTTPDSAIYFSVFVALCVVEIASVLYYGLGKP